MGKTKNERRKPMDKSKRDLEDVVTGMTQAEARLSLFLIISGVDPDYAILRAAGKMIESISLEEMMRRIDSEPMEVTL
jgi:hypothetical protein